MSWLNVSFNSLSKLHMLAFQLSQEEALLRAKLGRVQLEFNHWLLPTPAAIYDELTSETELFYWLQYSGETAVQSTCFQAVTPEKLEEWHHWWRLDKIRSARLLEAIRSLTRNSRQLSHAIHLLLKKLARPLFPFQLISREHAWSLLHGSHPPRLDAEMPQPAFAEPGRVCCESAC
jgi:hypothetical protein